MQAHRVVGQPQPPLGEQWLRVAAIRLPRISNSTDVEALACEPGVLVRWVTDPADLRRRRRRGDPRQQGDGGRPELAARPRPRRRRSSRTPHAGRPVLGICGGFQMLCRRIDDPVESGAGRVDGLGLLDADIVFARDKTLRHHEAPLHGLRDPPRPGRRARRGRLARASGSGAARCTARTGTACSTTTTFRRRVAHRGRGGRRAARLRRRRRRRRRCAAATPNST